ncbi:MAG: RNA-binding protein [Candidatus Cloacimonetes bacterium]|jgi:RNA recognition motif-containing protein|nr:RNA-binding protein [Candidatus Cloacimonadota bacterium]
MNIYIGLLPADTEKIEIQEIMERYGKVISIALVKKIIEGELVKFAIVDMPIQAEAEFAINKLNHTMFKGKNIQLNKARTNENGRRDEDRIGGRRATDF